MKRHPSRRWRRWSPRSSTRPVPLVSWGRMPPRGPAMSQRVVEWANVLIRSLSGHICGFEGAACVAAPISAPDQTPNPPLSGLSCADGAVEQFLRLDLPHGEAKRVLPLGLRAGVPLRAVAADTAAIILGQLHRPMAWPKRSPSELPPPSGPSCALMRSIATA